MQAPCPRCGTLAPDVARFCGHCGLALRRDAKGGGWCGAGSTAHPAPAAVPEDLAPITDAVDLYYDWNAAWGGPVLLGTETLALRCFNAGYDLAAVRLDITGCDEAGQAVFAVEREIPRWGHGEWQTVEIASWELSEPAASVAAVLKSAEFAPAEGA
jgi:hypothetical protein